jgi:tetratricopeptide (TPR) repeat protein
VWNDSFVWDDDQHVTENVTLRTLAGLRRIWTEPRATPQYYPLVHTTFWVEYHLWGASPLGYHLANVVLHAANALLLWRVLRRLAVPGAYLAAVLFAVHPVHVESVVWITERKNVLSTFFYLASALVLFRFWPPEENRPEPAGRWRFYVLALILFVAALLSKTVACALPPAFLLVRWWKQDRISVRDVLVSAPLFALGLALALPTVFLEKEHVGAQGAEWSFSFTERVLIAGRALWFYAGKLIWPMPLSFIYPRWEIDAGSVWQYGFPLAAVVVLVGLFLLRGRLGRGPLTAVLFFCGTLVPALGFFNVYPMRYSFVADHFQYLASVGLLALAAATFELALTTERPVVWYASRATCVLLIGIFTILTWRQAEVYRDVFTLWTDTLAKDPNCWMAYTNRGNAYAQSGQLEEALDDLSRAIELTPDQAEAHNNRALVYLRLGETQKALDDSTWAINAKPDYAKAYSTRGEVYMRLGQPEQSLADCNRAVELNPDLAEAYNNRGLAFLRLGKAEDAIRDFSRAIHLKPQMAGAFTNRGGVYLLKGQLQEAQIDFDRAIELEPDSAGAYGNRGMVHLLQGQLDRASKDFDRALVLQPDTSQVYLNRAMLHFARRNYDKAWMDVRRGEELGGTPNPKFIQALTDASGKNN